MHHYPSLPAFAIIALFLQACSWTNSEEGWFDAQEHQWYQCKASTDGSSWDCGKDAPSAPADNYAESRSEFDPEPELTATGQEPIDEPTQQDEQESSREVEQEAIADTVNLTIQVGAFAGEAQRYRFVQDNDLTSLKLDYREVVTDGRTWWVLTYGAYEDVEAGKLAQQSLEADYRLQGTWIRPLDQYEGVVKTPDEPTSQLAYDAHNYNYNANYRLQLAAFKSDERRQTFIQDKGLSDLELIYQQEDRNGETWWTLLYGHFEDVESAKQTQNELELKYGLGDTWIRPLE